RLEKCGRPLRHSRNTLCSNEKRDPGVAESRQEPGAVNLLETPIVGSRQVRRWIALAGAAGEADRRALAIVAFPGRQRRQWERMRLLKKSELVRSSGTRIDAGESCIVNSCSFSLPASAAQSPRNSWQRSGLCATAS